MISNQDTTGFGKIDLCGVMGVSFHTIYPRTARSSQHKL